MTQTRWAEVLFAVLAGSLIYEILAIGYGVATGDMSHTITLLVVQAQWSTDVGILVALVLGIGLAVHFYVERKQRYK